LNLEEGYEGEEEEEEKEDLGSQPAKQN